MRTRGKPATSFVRRPLHPPTNTCSEPPHGSDTFRHGPAPTSYILGPCTASPRRAPYKSSSRIGSPCHTPCIGTAYPPHVPRSTMFGRLERDVEGRSGAGRRRRGRRRGEGKGFTMCGGVTVKTCSALRKRLCVRKGGHVRKRGRNHTCKTEEWPCERRPPCASVYVAKS